jgi:hypothetical protein
MASQQPSGRSTAVTVVCLAVAIMAVFGAMNSYQVSARYAAQYPDAYGAGRAQVRFAPLLERVPKTAVLGYITDLDPSSNPYSAAFLAAQYALAPRQLVTLRRGAAPEVAVGNFSKPQDYAAAGVAHGYELTAELGNGVVLYRRRTAP